MGKTWSRGTNLRLPFGVNVNLKLSSKTYKHGKTTAELSEWLVSDMRRRTQSQNPCGFFIYIFILLEGYHLLKWTYLSKTYKKVKTLTLQLTFPNGADTNSCVFCEQVGSVDNYLPGRGSAFFTQSLYLC